VGLALRNGGKEAPLFVAGATSNNGKAYHDPSSSYKPNLQNIEPINIEKLMEREDLGNSGWFEPADFLRGKTATVDQSENRELYNSYSAKYVKEGQQYNHNYLADPHVEYDMWDQAFRMLGGYIDCDPNEMVENNSHDSGGGGEEGGRRVESGDDQGDGCTRWIIWAAHVRGDGSDGDGSGNVNGNAQGDDRRGLEQEEWNEEQENEDEEEEEDEKQENNNDNQMDTSDLDCHTRNTSWKLLGVYRQDYYQFLEQLTKHVWAYDSYEYNIMLATLEYTSTYCKQVGYHHGSPVYVDVMPIRGGYLHMGVYQDTSCIRPLSDKSVTYDDFYGNDDDGYERRRLSGSGDGEDNSYLMEYTLTEFNDIFETFRECTSCVDYPTYQDGYLIGDYGTDDESLINQVRMLSWRVLKSIFEQSLTCMF